MYTMEQKVVCRKRKTGLRPRLLLFLSALLVLIVLLFAAMESCVSRPALTLAEERGRALAAGTMSYAVMAALEEQQGDMLSVTDTQGDTKLVIADTAKLNYVASLASADAQRRMAELEQQDIQLDLGGISSVLLGGRGPLVSVRFIPVGSVTTETVSSLRSSGINQSIFSVELILTARLQLVLGGRSKVIEVTGRNLICQTVIVGEVPQVYTNVANEEDMLNLIPNEVP